MFHRAPEYVADPVNVVAHPWNEPGKVGQVFPIWITDRADTHSITVCPLITLHANSANRQQRGRVLLLSTLLCKDNPLFLSCHCLDPVQESGLLGHHLIIVDHQSAKYLSFAEVPFHVRFSICAKNPDGKSRSRERMPHGQL